MDIIEISDSGLGLLNVGVRVTDVEEDSSGILSVTAEEFPQGTATSVQYPVQAKFNNSTNQAIIPARVNTPVIYEPPAALTGGTPEVFAAISGGVTTAYKLAEDGSIGTHLTQQVMSSSQAGPSPGPAAIIAFSVYAQAVERDALRLNIFNGVSNIGCDFNLSSGLAGTPDAGISAAVLTNAGGGWFQCSITCLMAATANPIFYVLIEDPPGTISYPGTAGDGIYIWGAQYSAGTESATFIPAFASVSGAAIAANSVATPEGVAGVADPNWGGAYVWLSTDNATYGQIGQISAPSRHGVLTAAIAAPLIGNPDTINTLSVNLIESGGQLANATNSDAQNAVTLCLVDDELLAYGSAILTGTNAYNLTYLYRGLYGTVAAAHSIGAPFIRVDSAVFQYNLPPQFVGQLLYMKFQSFNVFGNSVEDLSECAVYTYTPNGNGQGLGPVSQALAIGTNLDYGLASEAVTESDDFGLASTAASANIDMGLASS